MRLIVDAHLDLAWNALSFDRDQTLPLEAIRAREAGMTGRGRAQCTTSLAAMRDGGVGICLATVLARALPAQEMQTFYAESTVASRQRGEVILREDLDFANQTICCAAAQGQLAYYRMLEYDGHLQMIRSAEDLQQAATEWQQWLAGQEDREPGTAAGSAGAALPGAPPIGAILSMEGADPIRSPKETAKWFENGLRTACLAHYGPSAYAMGTGGDGPLTPAGVELVREFDRLGILLDLVHTADLALEQALEHYSRPVFVSHGNCRSLVPHDRQMSDSQIRQIAARDGVLGVVLDAWMIVKDYDRNGNRADNPTLEHLALHVDHICQITGSSRHVGIGSDLDGGFGYEQTPLEVTSIEHLQLLGEILSRRGYTDETIDAIFHGNFLRVVLENLPGGSRGAASV